MVQVRFIRLQGEHACTCVADGATKRSKPLTALYVAVKSLSRVEQLKAMDIESGLVAVDLTSVALSAELLPHASHVPYRIARDAIRLTAHSSPGSQLFEPTRSYHAGGVRGHRGKNPQH